MKKSMLVKFALIAVLTVLLSSEIHAGWCGSSYGGCGWYGGCGYYGGVSYYGGTPYAVNRPGGRAIYGPSAGVRYYSNYPNTVSEGAVRHEESGPFVPSPLDTIPDAPELDPAIEIPVPAPNARNTRDDARIIVNVPADARVYVNDLETKMKGTSRRFVSHGLLNRLNYPYEVKVVMSRNDQWVEVSKEIHLRGGDVKSLTFDIPERSLVNLDDSPSPVETKLIVQVPESARVSLFGQETDVEGTVREFVTHELAEGQSWSDYPIEVHIEKEGQTLTAKKLVNFDGGDVKTIRFDFDEPFVAESTTPQVR